ncbi:MAG: glycosyltransferase family 2 protein [Polyangiaceae bacterium]
MIVPAYDEERLIARTLARLPPYVDHAIVVDDASRDRTREVVRGLADERVRLLVHARNRGVGAAIATGYQAALSLGADLLAVMAADDQMDPADLERLLAAAWQGGADYAKGNRFLHPEYRAMPRTRRYAGRALARLTCWATGLDIDDSQCGYTVLCARAARRLPLDELWPRYGYPNDLLGLLAEQQASIVEQPVRPVYADESSGVRPYHALVVAALIVRRAWITRRRRGSRAPALALGQGLGRARVGAQCSQQELLRESARGDVGAVDLDRHVGAALAGVALAQQDATQLAASSLSEQHERLAAAVDDQDVAGASAGR